MTPVVDTPSSRVAAGNCGGCIGSTAKAFGKGGGLMSDLELERNEHPLINLAA